MKEKEWKCPWIIIGEDTAGSVYWCGSCGSIRNDEYFSHFPHMLDRHFNCFDDVGETEHD